MYKKQKYLYKEGNIRPEYIKNYEETKLSKQINLRTYEAQSAMMKEIRVKK